MLRFIAIAAAGATCLAAHASTALSFSALGDGSPKSMTALRGGPYAVVVWKASCAPCVEELGHLRQIAADSPGWRFVTVALDDARTARAELPADAKFAEAWIAHDEPTVVLAQLNPAEPALPLTIAVDRRGRICARRVGLLGSDILKNWSLRCSR